MASLENQNQPLWFLKSKTPEGLYILMEENNKRHSKRFHYLNPVFAKGNWYVWFEIKKSDIAKDTFSGKK